MAIVVNTNRQYPQVAEALQTGSAVEAFANLQLITAGEWPNLRPDLLTEWGDVLIGSARNTVTAVYRIDGWQLAERSGRKKLRFQVHPAPEFTALIGQPIPGGPWARGEARGTRRVATPDRCGEPDPGLTWKAAVVATARRLFPVPPGMPRSVATVDFSRIEVRWRVRPEGTVVVEVPEGVPVLVRPTRSVAPEPPIVAALNALAANPPDGEDYQPPVRDRDRPAPW